MATATQLATIGCGLSSGASATTNYNNASTLKIGTEGSKNHRAILRLPCTEIPAGACLVSATLVLKKVGGTLSSSKTFYARRLRQESLDGPFTNEFVASQVTWTITYTGLDWQTAGGDYQRANQGITTASTPGDLSFDVTSQFMRQILSRDMEDTVVPGGSGEDFVDLLIMGPEDEAGDTYISVGGVGNATEALKPYLELEWFVPDYAIEADYDTCTGITQAIPDAPLLPLLGSMVSNPGSLPLGLNRRDGTLSTRGGNSSGVFTATDGQTTGVFDGIADVYWSGGSRLGMATGSGGSTTWTLTGGTGDNLPSLNTAIWILEKSNALLTLDLTSIPSGSTVEAAGFAFELDGLPDGVARSYTMHVISGTYVGSEATWLNRSDGVAWTTPGGDYGAAVVTFPDHYGCVGYPEPTVYVNNSDLASLVETYAGSVVRLLIKQTSQSTGNDIFEPDLRSTEADPEVGIDYYTPRLFVKLVGGFIARFDNGTTSEVGDDVKLCDIIDGSMVKKIYPA